MRIEAQFDCTQRGLVLDIARIVYASHGHVLPQDPLYLFRSQHPTEKSALAAAEATFGIFNGDSPDYSDEEEDDDRQ